MALSPNSITRSSLEEMLESLRRRDEKPKDMPPALPARAKIAPRARPPSTKRNLPTSFFEAAELVMSSSSSCNLKKDDRGLKGNRFGFKRAREVELGESPYVIEEEEHQLRCDDVGYFIEKKLGVWCQRDSQWELGKIQSTSGDKASVMLSDKTVVNVPLKELLPANPDTLDGVDDLVQLSYLNEPSVLHNLENRYSQDLVYSKAGPLLLAVNPYKEVELYGDDVVTAYQQKILESPHVYATADTLYNEMMTDGINQSIIISGDSGSGKSETAKNALEYLATLSGGIDGVESEVRQANSILEAFGNAKTSSNHNSSRFGKLIEIHFNSTGKLCGAKIQTLLLEKSRVVQLCQGERSYHIFYQLCAGASSDLRGRLKLKNACDYNYLSRSGCLEIHDVDDAQKFSTLMGALDTLRICREDQEHAFEMLAAVLWLGNISFHAVDDQKSIEVVADEAVNNAASLIGCGFQDLMMYLSTRRLQSGENEVTQKRTLKEATDSRDALAKHIYGSLFDWLVEKINLSLASGKHQTGMSISILDLCGFDSIQNNSFEQFYVNYANERLQQHFNRHLFKLEQQDCEFDGVQWTKVDFEDNQDCLDLFEKKPNGLISLLDEELNLTESTDSTFATKLKQHLNSNTCFKVDKSDAFSVRHHSGEVLYDVGGFLEKNRDALHSEATQLLKKTLKPADSLEKKPQSIAIKFKGHLFKLIQQLETTKPHFIRCIKPNTKQSPGVFEKDLVLQQLRCSQVLEVVNISRLGYPTRMPHQEFVRRYSFVLPKNRIGQDPLSTSLAILKQFDIFPEMYQVGYTKIFLRTGQIDFLEAARKKVMHGSVEIKKHSHNYTAPRNFHELKGGVVTMQSYIRGEIARKEYNAFHTFTRRGSSIEQQQIAVIQIQSVIRGWLARKHYKRSLNSTNSFGTTQKAARRLSEVMAEEDSKTEIVPPVVEELRKQVLMVEVTLEEKEKENAGLKEQLQQNEARWSEYESKMKSMEDMWQKQMTSLQASLAAAKKSLGADRTNDRLDGFQSPHHYDSEDTALGPPTPGGTTPVRYPSNGRQTNGASTALGPLVKEFEQSKQTFDTEALAIVEYKQGDNSMVELRRLKQKFESWKKDYKARLREAKGKIAEKHRRKWWGMKSK